MGIEFTNEQKKVIYTRNKNMLVSAAAGSGKTAVLVERIIQMITDTNNPVDIDRLLVVTFTEAAAAEMKDRIRRALDTALDEDPANVFLQKQASLLYKAQISTIHSFCLNLIRNNFNAIGLDPNFRIADETELKLMRLDVIDELFEELYKEKDADFIKLVDYFNEDISDDKLKEYIFKIYDFSQGNPWPEEWLDAQIEKYNIKDEDSLAIYEYLNYVYQYALGKINGALKKIQQIKLLMENPSAPDYSKVISQDEEIIKDLLKAKDIDELRIKLFAVKFLNLTKSSECDEDIKKAIVKLRNWYKDALVTPSKESSLINLLRNDLKIENQMLHLIYPVMLKLGEIIKQFSSRYKELRKSKNVISFSDMEHYSLDILYDLTEDGEHVTSLIAKEYQDAFDEILMDEYQDCNRVQEYLMSSISGEENGRYNRFMVGDVKQSIYKFRLANPRLFINKYECYECDDLLGQQENNCIRIDLHSNFRSRESVINSVNDLFGQIMHKDLGEVEYDDDAKLIFGADFPSYEDDELVNRCELTIDDYEHIDEFDKTQALLFDLNNEGNLVDKELYEAKMIAYKIKEMVGHTLVTDKETKQLRKARYKDIVILLRSMGSNAISLKQVLSNEGIPSLMNLSTGFYDAKEIQVLLQLLKVIDNPRQDIPLFGCLKSFFVKLSDEEIASIKINTIKDDDLNLCLYDRLLLIKDSNDKVLDFLNRLSDYRKRAIYTPIHQLISEIINEEGYLEYISAMAGGEQRRANVLMLIAKASAYENSSYKGLFHFNRYIMELKKIESDEGEADILDENSDVVRIMTIHKSKGLEFPICIIGSIHKQFNFRDASGLMTIDMDFGIGASFVDLDKRVKSTPLYQKVINLKLKQDVIGEELRVLYVAMTRAKEKLIVTGVIDGAEDFLNKVNMMAKICKEDGRMPLDDIASAKSYMDLMMPILTDATIITTVDFNKAKIIEDIDKIALKNQLLMGLKDINDTDSYKELVKRMQRTYDKEILISMPPKTSVSDLKKAYIDDTFTEELFKHEVDNDYIPGFIQEKNNTISGTERGSAYHKVMELLNFIEPDIKSQINNLINIGRISKEWAQAVPLTKIKKFMESDLGKRMATAQENGALYREQPFVLGIEANRVKEEYPKEELLLLQGIIDAYFIENNEIVLLDYKTDVINSSKELIDRYKVQLDYYIEALERIVGMKVKEAYLYSFHLQECVEYIKN